MLRSLLSKLLMGFYIWIAYFIYEKLGYVDEYCTPGERG